MVDREVFLIFLVLLVLTLSGCDTEENPNLNDTFFKDYSKPDFLIINSTDDNDTATITDANYYKEEPKVDNSDYLIGAINIQIFGEKKATSNIMPYIVDIIDDYDIIGIQEVRDSTGTVIGKLNDIEDFGLRASPRLGRTRSKEQYIFMYSNRVTPSTSAVYPDINDDFEREPFGMNFIIDGELITFLIVHIKPDDAEMEIKKLDDVVEWAENELGEDVIVMGDLNADCVYFDSFDVWKSYEVLIDEHSDTTVGLSDCAYDRIYTKSINPRIIEVGIDKYSEETNGNEELISSISDHYAVYMVFDKIHTKTENKSEN